MLKSLWDFSLCHDGGEHGEGFGAFNRLHGNRDQDAFMEDKVRHGNVMGEYTFYFMLDIMQLCAVRGTVHRGKIEPVHLSGCEHSGKLGDQHVDVCRFETYTVNLVIGLKEWNTGVWSYFVQTTTGNTDGAAEAVNIG